MNKMNQKKKKMRKRNFKRTIRVPSLTITFLFVKQTSSNNNKILQL